MAFERHQRTLPKALWVPAGVMWQSEAPLNPSPCPSLLPNDTRSPLSNLLPNDTQ